jgi:hypothetical protein
MLHVGYSTRSTLLPVLVHVRLRTPLKHALRPIYLGGRLSRDLASIATKATYNSALPVVLEDVSPP